MTYNSKVLPEICVRLPLNSLIKYGMLIQVYEIRDISVSIFEQFMQKKEKPMNKRASAMHVSLYGIGCFIDF